MKPNRSAASFASLLTVGLVLLGWGLLSGCAYFRGWGAGSSGGGARVEGGVSIPLGK